MRYYLIRHGKTDANRTTRAAYGKQGAPLNDEGRQQAGTLHETLLALGIDPRNEVAAVSELLRTQQTAELAGLKKTVTTSMLNEVNTPDPQKTTDDLKRGILAEEAVVAAKNLLAHPPKERLWVTHGQLIAAILAELKQISPNKFIPDFCEVTAIDL